MSSKLSHLHLLKSKTAEGLLAQMKKIDKTLHGLGIIQIMLSKDGEYLAYVRSEAQIKMEEKDVSSN